MMTKLRRLTLLITLLTFVFVGCEEIDQPQPDDKDPVEQPGDKPSDPDDGSEDVFVEEQDDTSADPVGQLNYSLLKAKGHPRLLCDAVGFAQLKKKVTSERFDNPTLTKLHNEVIARADKIIEKSRSFSTEDDYYVIVDNLLSCAYAYKMKGQDKYLAKVRADLTKVCSFSGWLPSGLGIGEISMAVALVYDWLYYDLSLEHRSLAHRALVRNGIRPMFNNNTNVETVGNWNQINLGGVAIASMAVYEKDKQVAYQQIEKALKGNLKGVEGIYRPNGNYAEGLGYWEYGGGYEACFLSCLKGIFGHTAGIAEVPGFMDSGEYALYMHGTMNTTFTYNDGGGTKDPFLLTSWWFAAQKDDPTLMYCERRRLYDDKSVMNKDVYKNTTIDGTEQPYRLLAPMVVMLRDFDMESRPVNPPTREVWSGQGEKPVVMVRRGWNFDENDVFLGMMGGIANSWRTSRTAHAHMDAGAFVFEAEGVRWSDDIMRPNYGPWYEAMRKAESPRKYTAQNGVMWDTFHISNLCHSTIVSYTNDGSVSGKLHSSDYYVDGFASIDEVIDSGDRQGGVINMTETMTGQVKKAVRKVELVNGTDLVVTDEITALDNHDCILEWRMLSMTTSTINTDGIVLTKNGKERRLSMVPSSSSATPKYMKWDTKLPTDDNWGKYMDKFHQTIPDREIVGWTVTVPKGQKVTFITTLKK